MAHDDLERLKRERGLTDDDLAYYDAATIDAMLAGDYG